MHGWIFQTRPRFNWCPVHQRKRQVSVSQRNIRPLLQQLETGGSFLEYGLSAALEEEKCLLETAISFIFSGARMGQQSGGRSRRAIGAIAAVTACARLVVGEPIKSAACYALSIFNICKKQQCSVTRCWQHHSPLKRYCLKIWNACNWEMIKFSSQWKMKSKEHRKMFANWSK